jgi:NADH-quinone oxidoreductase subunit J
MIEGVGPQIAFWHLALITVGSAFAVTATRNLIHALLFLVLTFVGVAGLFLLMSAEFLAIAQVLIYVGGISILLVFAIVLTPRNARDNSETAMLPFGALGAVLIATMVIFTIFNTEWSTVDERNLGETARAIGEALLDRWVLPFEIAAALLVVAMVGSLVIVRGERPGELNAPEPRPDPRRVE